MHMHAHSTEPAVALLWSVALIYIHISFDTRILGANVMSHQMSPNDDRGPADSTQTYRLLRSSDIAQSAAEYEAEILLYIAICAERGVLLSYK